MNARRANWRMRITAARSEWQSTSKQWRWVFYGSLVIILSAILLETYWGWLRSGPTKHEIATSNQPVSLINAFQPVTTISVANQLALKVDVTQDDWDTEVLNERAGAQFKELGRLIQHSVEIGRQHVKPLVADHFTCQILRPTDLVEVYSNKHLVVLRPKNKNRGNNSDKITPYHGIEGLIEALQRLGAGLGTSRNKRVKFKLFQIETAPQHFTTRSSFEAIGRNEDQSVQLNAIWECRWQFPSTGSGNKPRLEWIGIAQFEEVIVHADRGRLFVDCTEAALGSNESYQAKVLMGLDHWIQRLDRSTGISIFGYHGITIGDVNGDELEDIYVCDAGGLPNCLYLQQPDGTLINASTQSGVDFLDDSTSSLLVDLDNDGDQDLAVMMRTMLLINENDGNGQFIPRGEFYVTASPRSICAADYDNDGNLDIYLCGYSPSYDRKLLRAPLPYHDANNGGRNTLLHNQGDFVFVDATQESGLDTNNSRFSFAAAWEDYDNDGDLDLYVANDFGRNNLYQNENGQFTDIAAELQVEDIASGMSVSWGDYNRDGWMDLYVANMFSAAGSRVTYQRRFREHKTDQTVTDTRRMARGNSLFSNQGSHFDDVSLAAAVTMGRWAWASKFVDLNNDGWLDLMVANGFITTADASDL